MDRSVVAMDMFSKKFNCAQSVLYAFSQELGLDPETALKVSCGFGAGMARGGEVCGAVTGGVMVLGMRHGRGANDDRAAMESTYAKTRELFRLFAARHGSCSCRRLLNGCDLTMEEGQRSFKENNYLDQVCKKCVLSVVEILEQLR